MRQRILGSHTPPCHKRMVITTQFNVLPCCTAAQTSSVPLQVAFEEEGGGGKHSKEMEPRAQGPRITRRAGMR